MQFSTLAALAGESAPARWAMGWEACVAIGTSLLALATAMLAARTHTLSDEAAADERAQWRPVMLPAVDRAYEHDIGASVYHDPRRGQLGIILRNAGRGPALHVRVQLEVAGISVWLSPEVWSLGAVAPGDAYRLCFHLTEPGESMQLLVDYRDLAGRSYATSIMLVVIEGQPRPYDVRTWEDHAVTSEADAPYPMPGLTNVAPKPKPVWLSPDWPEVSGSINRPAG